MGYSRSDVEDRKLFWQNLTPPEYMGVSRAEIQKFLATGRVGPYEKEYFCKDGTKRWLLFAGSSLGNNQCVEFCIDIADRKRAEEALRESEGRERERAAELAGILDAAPVALFIAKDPECREMVGSRMTYEMLRLAPGAAVPA
jgi:PAS domain-containing protein